MKQFIILKDVFEETEQMLEKSYFKYIRKVPTGNYKNPWYYVYENTLKKPFVALKNLFGLDKKQVSDSYEKEEIKKTYGCTKETFGAHILEFFSKKKMWNEFFLKKANREKYKKPIYEGKEKKDTPDKKTTNKTNGKSSASKTTPKKPGTSNITTTEFKPNKSIMYKVWTMYSPAGQQIAEKEKNEAKNKVDPIEKVVNKVSPSEKLSNDLLSRENIELEYREDIPESLQLVRNGYLLGSVYNIYDRDGNFEETRIVASAGDFKDWNTTKKQLLEYYELTRPKDNKENETPIEKLSDKQIFDSLKDVLKNSGLVPKGELESLSLEHIDDMKRLAEQIKDVPDFYAGDHTAKLHYFVGDKDYYITEMGDDGEAYGYVDNNGDPSLSEFGYMDINELVNGSKGFNQVNIDLHFTPQPIAKLIKDSGHNELYNSYIDTFPEDEIEETEQEKHENRSNAMLGNQNAKKNGTNDDKENQGGLNDNTRTNGNGLSGTNGEIHTGRNEGNSGNNGSDTANGTNGSEPIQRIGQSGERPTESDSDRDGAGDRDGNDPRTRVEIGRATKGDAKKIREQCLEILKKPDSEITKEDLEVLKLYEGAGGLYNGNADTLQGNFNEFYTPRDVIEKVWELVDKYMPNKNKKVLEPSAGTGRFAEGRSEDFTLNEMDPTSARIAHLLHPNAKVTKGEFQKYFVGDKNNITGYKGDKFDVVVGNPPYGDYEGFYKGLGEGKEFGKNELPEYFISRSLDTMKEGGILAMVVPSTILRGKKSKAKELIAKKGKLLESWRLPSGAFSSTAVGTDIIIIQKGKGDINDYINNNYFEDNPDMVLGTETNEGNWESALVKLDRTGASKEDDIRNAINKIDPNKVAIKQEIKDALKKVETKVVQPSTNKITVIGKLAVGASITKPDGTKGTITEIDYNKGMISYTADDKTGGKIPIDRFDCVDDRETEEEIHRNRSEAMKGNQNAKKDFKKQVTKKAKNGELYTPSSGKNQTADEFNKHYNKNTPKEDIKFWKTVDWEGNVNTKSLTAEEIAELANNPRFINIDGKYTPTTYYASGNIYNKLKELEAIKDSLSEDEYYRRKDLLDNAKPAQRKIDQFTISPIANFAKQYKDDDGNSLTDLFIKSLGFEESWGDRYYLAHSDYLSENELDEGITKWDILEYVQQIPVKAERAYSKEDKETEAMRASLKKTSRRETAERLFNDWLRNKLPVDKQNEIAKAWNERFNAYVNPDYEAIPLFVEGMNTHKGNHEFNMTEQQIKGISELCNKGNGILAYDVGVGKTVCGIVATVNQMQTGKAERPLICVPKAVYKNWIASIHQHFPNVEINELNNFSKKDLDKYKDSDGKVNLPKNRLNICTYEALENITFKQETLEGDLQQDMRDSQSVYDYNPDGSLKEDKRTEKQRQKQLEEIQKALGVVAQAKEGAVYWEDLGIDHMTVDELHNFKNIFSSPRNFSRSQRESDEKKGERLSNEFQGIGGATSKRGMKMFAISQLIQQKTDGKGFYGLSATPFNNSPVEIYNILSLVARNRLKDLNIYNLQDFLREFAEMKPDWKVKADGTVQNELVMKNFKNLGALQNLITEFIDKVDGEEAGVIRPYKRTHKPMLDLTPLQKFIIDAETARISGEFSNANDDNTADTLIAMNNMRMATLSPTLIDPKFYADYEQYAESVGYNWEAPDKNRLVEESPKLKFVSDMTSKQYKARPKEGQVIYMPRGVNEFPKVKEYLVKQGIPADAIAFIDSKVKNEKKEEIMNDFNDPDGKIKVIIGSETIKEGVNLNGNSSTIYNTMLGWNPTETIQVEGRIWRQGNKQGVTHVVYPLMNDSIDSMMYQKYDEKSSRLNALYSYKGDSLNVEDIDPEELKFELIKNPVKRADLKIQQEEAQLKKDKRLADSNYDKVFQTSQEYQANKDIIESKEKLIEAQNESLNSYQTRLKDYEKTLAKVQKEAKKYPDDKTVAEELKDAQIDVDRMKYNIKDVKSTIRLYEKQRKDAEGMNVTLLNSLKRQGVDDIKNVDKKLTEISNTRQEFDAKLEQLKTRRTQLIDQYSTEIALAQKNQKHYTVEDQVNNYVNAVANDLKDADVARNGIETAREMTKEQLENVINQVEKEGRARLGEDTVTSKDLSDLNKLKNQSKSEKSLFVIQNGRLLMRKSINNVERKRQLEEKKKPNCLIKNNRILIKKSLTFSGYKLQGRTNFHGMNISIENKKGSTRKGEDDNGHHWEIKMNYDYGYIRGTEGVDGDHLDCYIGNNENAKNVYIVHQNNPDTHKYDEDKCMLGFNSKEEAKKAYLSQYDRPGFLGDISVVPIETFKEKIFQKKYHKKKLDI